MEALGARPARRDAAENPGTGKAHSPQSLGSTKRGAGPCFPRGGGKLRHGGKPAQASPSLLQGMGQVWAREKGNPPPPAKIIIINKIKSHLAVSHLCRRPGRARRPRGARRPPAPAAAFGCGPAPGRGRCAASGPRLPPGRGHPAAGRRARPASRRRPRAAGPRARSCSSPAWWRRAGPRRAGPPYYAGEHGQGGGGAFPEP